MPIKVLMGYDGSPAASAAIDAGGQLFPQAHAWVAHLWTPPFASPELRQRLWNEGGGLNAFIEAVEREGEREASRLAGTGVTLARAAGWDAEPLVQRSHGGEGLRFAELAEKVGADVVVVGSRGLGGARAVLGSVSDMVVHYAPRPVLVVPYPLLIAEYEALSGGPVLVGFDGSASAQRALATAVDLFPTRHVVPVAVDHGPGGDQAEAEGPGEAPERGAELVRLPGVRGYRSHGRTIATTLAGYAGQQEAAVLVVGSRGRSAVREIVLGSVAMAVLHHAHRPVLVVPSADRSAGSGAA